MYMRFFLLKVLPIILLLCKHIASYAQVPSPLEQKIIPPSPEAANLGRFGDVPVSLNTGTAHLSIPLYQIGGKDLSLPISLDYAASGNRVSDVASWTGLGWTLNSGGLITRVVKGLPDETPIIGYFSQYKRWLEVKDLPPATPITSGPKYDFQRKAALGQVDTQ